MGRTLDEVVADLPPEDVEWVRARSQELIAEVEKLREPRRTEDSADAPPPAPSPHNP